jgi:hypothetical protein
MLFSTLLPELCSKNIFTSRLQQLLKSHTNSTSGGCILCVQSGGKQNNAISFPRAVLIALKFLYAMNVHLASRE